MKESLLAKIFVSVGGAVGALFGLSHTDTYVNPAPVHQIVKVATTTRQTATTTITSLNKANKATSTAKVAKKKAKIAVQTKAKPSPLPPAQIKPKDLIPLEKLNEDARSAMVNIFCTTKQGGDFEPLTGSGIIIDPRGVILTNAHVAQYFLLKNYRVENFINCIARTGSPAKPAYKISLLYIPDNWLSNNAKIIKDENPLGTGENDYALLLITDSASNSPLPKTFPFIPIDPEQKNITGDVPVLLVGYPAGLLGGIEAQYELWLVSSRSFLTKLYYFEEKKNIDAFSLGGNILAQKGVSGGVAINQWSGKVEGILTTITEAKTTGERDLSAISIAHVNRSFTQNTRKSISEFLSGDLNKTLEDFATSSMPNLTKTLTDALNSTSTPTN